ncbi:hypothetical protein [Acidithiobacillus ferrivorans]|uniref:hypothetical protein n=1 Tax=Acidithiobacillus ferrivorans TaxID=160808 RepID=UPI001D014B46|nr:hypothetical protein [Acidithiobacillus ferrivorans]
MTGLNDSTQALTEVHWNESLIVSEWIDGFRLDSAPFVPTLSLLIFHAGDASMTTKVVSSAHRSTRLGLCATPEQEVILRRAADVAHKL